MQIAVAAVVSPYNMSFVHYALFMSEILCNITFLHTSIIIILRWGIVNRRCDDFFASGRVVFGNLYCSGFAAPLRLTVGYGVLDVPSNRFKLQFISFIFN